MTESEIESLATEFNLPVEQLRATHKELVLELSTDVSYGTLYNVLMRGEYQRWIAALDFQALMEVAEMVNQRIVQLHEELNALVAARDTELVVGKLQTIVDNLKAVHTLN